jgi:hypothetical protein
LLHTGNSHDATTDTTELGIACSISALKHIHDGAYESVAVLDQLTLASKRQGLEKQSKASLHKYLVAIKAEREAQLALVEKFDNLHDMLAGIANGYYG